MKRTYAWHEELGPMDVVHRPSRRPWLATAGVALVTLGAAALLRAAATREETAAPGREPLAHAATQLVAPSIQR